MRKSVIIYKYFLFQSPFLGQTFCFRTMFTEFMVDASNILQFEGFSNVTSDIKYSMEFWIFKPKSYGQQVIEYSKFKKILYIYYISVCALCSQPWWNWKSIFQYIVLKWDRPPLWVAQLLHLHWCCSSGSSCGPQWPYSGHSIV